MQTRGKGKRLTNPIPNLLDLLARLSIGDVYVDSSMQRGVCVGSILVVDVDLEVEDLRKHLRGLRSGSVVQSVAPYAVAVIRVECAGGDDLLQKLEVVCSCCVEQPLVCHC